MDDEDLKFQNWKQFVTESLADAAMRHEQSAKRMDRFERNLVRLANLGRRARSDIKRRQQEQEDRQKEHEARQKEHEARQKEHETNMARIELTLAEIGDKLNGLIGYVQDQHPPQQ